MLLSLTLVLPPLGLGFIVLWRIDTRMRHATADKRACERRGYGKQPPDDWRDW